MFKKIVVNKRKLNLHKLGNSRGSRRADQMAVFLGFGNLKDGEYSRKQSLRGVVGSKGSRPHNRFTFPATSNSPSCAFTHESKFSDCRKLGLRISQICKLRSIVMTLG